jgi:carbonic anhydrase
VQFNPSIEHRFRFKYFDRLQPKAQDPGRAIAIVTCMSPRLNRFLPAAFGVDDDEAYLIRNAGGTGTRWDESVLRSVAVAVQRGVRHVAVVGHTGCSMAQDLLPFLNALREQGIPREAFGDRDPREWLGVLPGIEPNVRAMVDLLRRSPLLPAGVALYGMILDSDTGALRALASEQTASPAATTSRTAPRRPDSVEQVLGGKVTEAPSPSATSFSIPSPAAPSGKTPDSAADLLAPEPARKRSAAAEAVPAILDRWKPDPAPPPPSSPSLPAAPAGREEQPKPKPARPNVSRDAVPIDPREAQEYFRRRDADRERRKHRTS